MVKPPKLGPNLGRGARQPAARGSQRRDASTNTPDDGNTDEPVTATPVSPSAAACASAAAPSLTLASNAMHESHGAMGRRGVTPPPPPSYTTLPTPAFRAAYEDALFGTPST